MIKNNSEGKILKSNATSIPEAIYRIVEAAMQAPSGDNCQPWRFEWNGHELCVSHNEEKARHAFNRANHASYISLGCVLESISIAASHENLKAVYALSHEALKESISAVITFTLGPKLWPPAPVPP